MIVKFSVILSSSSTSDWTVDNTLSIISIVLVIIGGIFTFIQWAAANHIKRTELISQILEKLRFDDDMIFAMQIIDYGNDWYNDEFHDGTNGYEQKFNKLFSYSMHVVPSSNKSFFSFNIILKLTIHFRIFLIIIYSCFCRPLGLACF